MITLPDSAEGFKDATWEDVLPYYEELEARPVDRSTVESWLADWSRFESLLSEAAALAHFAYATNTADPASETAELRFGTQIAPKADEQRVRLQERLVELDYTRPDLETMIRRFRNHIEMFDEANVTLFAELSELVTQWSKINGALTVEWAKQNGSDKTAG